MVPYRKITMLDQYRFINVPLHLSGCQSGGANGKNPDERGQDGGKAAARNEDDHGNPDGQRQERTL